MNISSKVPQPYLGLKKLGYEDVLSWKIAIKLVNLRLQSKHTIQILICAVAVNMKFEFICWKIIKFYLCFFTFISGYTYQKDKHKMLYCYNYWLDTPPGTPIKHLGHFIVG